MRLLLLLLISVSSLAQTRLPDHKNTFFHLGIVPGMSTAGLNPEYNIEQASIFLFSGYSAATEGFGFALIQNLNTSFSKGIFIAGFSNMVGINSKRYDKDKDFKTLESNLEGIQFSGFMNLVRDNTFGSQISGGLNITQGGFFGFQLASTVNVVKKYTFGIQLAGLSNISTQSINGVQIASFSNSTKGQLEGIQIASYNKAGIIHGKNSHAIDAPTGIQIGIFNYSKIMNGFQIGLINIGRQMQGTQIGLINFAGSGETHLTKDGTAIGLLNFGSGMYLQSYLDEKLNINYELGTGIIKNGRLLEEINKYFFSSITYSKSPIFHSKENWMVGYGLFKMWTPRTINRGEYYFSSVGVQIFHYNPQDDFIKKLNPLLRVRYMYGKNIKKSGIFVFASITGNMLFKEYQSTENFVALENKIKIWPGGQFGLMMK